MLERVTGEQHERFYRSIVSERQDLSPREELQRLRDRKEALREMVTATQAKRQRAGQAKRAEVSRQSRWKSAEERDAGIREQVERLHRQRGMSVRGIAKRLGIGRVRVARILKRRNPKDS